MVMGAHTSIGGYVSEPTRGAGRMSGSGTQSAYQHMGPRQVPSEAGVNYPGVNAYLRALPASTPGLTAVSVSVRDGAMWIVTEISAGGDLARLEPLYAAELAARSVAAESGVALVFRILDTGFERSNQDAPRDAELIRLR